ncbi:MAG TPA: DinB family protein [Candidatus Eisenbacteria bacterium]
MNDLDAALLELTGPVEQDPMLWTRGRPRKWTAGQHVEHVAITLAATADALEQAEQALRDGGIASPPRRGPLQAMWVGLVAVRGTLPRGGRTPGPFEPTPAPDRAATLAYLRRETDRHRSLGERLSVGQRDRLWIPNPFLLRWHYTFPEMVRVQAVHVRHHACQILELLPARSR